MTLDGLLTFLTLLIGSLTFMPPVLRLRMRLSILYWVAWSLIGAAGVFYFEFFNSLAIPCPAWPGFFGGFCGKLVISSASEDVAVHAITPQQAAFLVVVAWMATTIFGFLRPQLPAYAMGTLDRMIGRLALQRRFADIVELIEPDLDRIVQCANRGFALQRLHDWLAGRPTPDLGFAVEVIGRAKAEAAKISDLRGTPLTFEDKLSTVASREAIAAAWRLTASWCFCACIGCARWIARRLAKAVPEGKAREEAADRVLAFVMKRREVLDHLLNVRVAFGARLMLVDHFYTESFAQTFLSTLIERRGSALYDEIANSQNTRGVGYLLSPDAAVLHALLDDVRVAKDLTAERAVAERALANLNPVNDPGYVSSLNLSYDVWFDEHGRWQDPTFVTIKFFEIMVPAAAEQGIEWHMSLLYMRTFVEMLTANYDETAKGVDPYREWPTRAAHLISAAMGALQDWIAMAAGLPPDSSHRHLDNDKMDWETGNIPKTAAMSLGECMQTVIQSDAINERFKVGQLSSALMLASTISPQGDLSKLRTVLLKSLAQGGIVDAGGEYRARLRHLYADIDHVLRFKLKDFEAMIGWPSPPREPTPQPPPPPPRSRARSAMDTLAGIWTVVASRTRRSHRRRGK